MLRFYHEDSEFDAFTQFDSKIGKLKTITQHEFEAAAEQELNALIAQSTPTTADGLIRRTQRNAHTFFTGEIQSTHARFPRRVYFQITRNCNLDCGYCFIKAIHGGADVPLPAIKDIAQHLGKQGLMEVRLTGGEPTTHPHILDVIDTFHQNDVYVSLATNGIIHPRVRDALTYIDHLWLICSVDGPKHIHERYRPNTFNRIIRNLIYLKTHNPSIRFRLTTVLTKENAPYVGEVGRIAAEVGAESVNVIPLRPQVRNMGILSDMVSSSQFKEVIELLLAAKVKYGIPFTTTMETEYKSQIFPDSVVRKKSSCAAGREGTNLDYNAATGQFQVYGCSYSPASDLSANPAIRAPFLAGTFTAKEPETFSHIWHDSSRWTIYRDLSIRSNACKGCTYLKHNQCTGSCPIQNIDLSKVDAKADVLVQLTKQIQQNGEWYCYQTLDKQ